MDRFRVIWYLLEDYNKHGSIYPKSAKEIAEKTSISLTETYLTLQELKEEGLIWRVGRRNLYRFGLKEEKLQLLDGLFQCVLRNKQLPTELEIRTEQLEKLAYNKQLQSEKEQEQKELISEITNSLSKLEIIEEKVCINKIEIIVNEIIDNINLFDDPDGDFTNFIQEKLTEGKEYVFGLKVKEENCR